MGALLEKYFGSAEKTLQPEVKKERWPGKLTVYVFAERDEFTTFVRRIERRRLEPEETATHAVEGDLPRVVVGPPRSKPAPNLETQAGEEVASALLQRKAGARVPLPAWLLAGFGRATTWRLAPREKTTLDARRDALAWVATKRRTAGQVWRGEVEAAETGALGATLADLLAYGPGASRFPGFVAGFRPADGQERRSTEQALEAAGIKIENLEKVWLDFVRNPR